MTKDDKTFQETPQTILCVLEMLWLGGKIARMSLLQKAALCLCSLALLLGSAHAGSHVQEGTKSEDCADAASQDAAKLTQKGKLRDLSEALKLYQQALDCDMGARSIERRGEIFLQMGRVQLLLEKPQDALNSFSRSAEVFRKIQNRSNSVLTQYARALLNQAFALGNLRRMDDALPVYNEAGVLFRSMSDKPREAFTLGELCRVHFLLGDNQSALASCSQALELRHKIDNNDDENQRQKSTLLDYQGRIYAQTGEPELAAAYFHDSLAIAERTKYYLLQAYTLNDLGALLLRQHNAEGARRCHQQALDILSEYEPNDAKGIAETKTLLADAQAASGRYGLALQNYQTALLLQEKAGDEIGMAETHFSLGLNELASGHFENALLPLQKAAEIYRRVHERAGESNARFQIARVFSFQRHVAEAKTELQTAIRLAEEIREFTPGFHLRTTYFVSLEKMYRFEIDLILQHPEVASASDQALAFDLLQRAQSRALLETLEARFEDAKLTAAGDLLSRQQAILLELSKQNRKLQWLLQDESATAQIDGVRVAVKRLEASLDQVEAEDMAKEPRLALLSGRVMSVADIQREVLDENSTLVQFYLSHPSSFAWVITKLDAKLVRLPAEAIIARHVRNLSNFGEAGRWTELQHEALAALDHSLAPVFNASGNGRWILVPDRALYLLPFGLLSIRRAISPEIIKIPSASAIRALRSSNANLKTPFKVAVFADPVFDAQDSRVKTSRKATESLHPPARLQPDRHGYASYSRLLYSRREAGVISSLVPQVQRVAYMGFAATPDSVRGDALKEFQIIHFATHSVIDNRHPELSRIVLSLVSENGLPHPGYLLLKDIYRMSLASDLVVLSSCQTAIGPQDVGEGPMSLSRGFLFAGSKSVLATLWAVDDEATAEFVGRFYKHLLKEHLSPLDALTKTQSEYRQHTNRRLRNPYYWAGFELYGDWLVH
jgi:CHAT domain-containing protein